LRQAKFRGKIERGRRGRFAFHLDGARLESGIVASAPVPSGASTGEGEAHELRDHDPRRHGGRSVFKAVANLAETDRVPHGRDPADQAAIDRLMIGACGAEFDVAARRKRHW
jgi:enolase